MFIILKKFPTLFFITGNNGLPTLVSGSDRTPFAVFWLAVQGNCWVFT